VVDEIAKACEQQAVNDKQQTNGFVHRADGWTRIALASDVLVGREVRPDE
jgi:hypothetical protein